MGRVPIGYQNKTYCLDFEVEGALDGTTQGPPIEDSPPSAQNADDPQNLFRRTVQNLGLLDPDYLIPESEEGRQGTRGNRLVTFLWVSGPLAGGPGASVDVVDAVDQSPQVQKDIGSLAGLQRFYTEGVVIPQGSAIRLDGMSATPGSPIRVRIHIQFIDSTTDLLKAFPPPSSSVGNLTLAQVLANGNNSGANGIILDVGQQISWTSPAVVDNDMGPDGDNTRAFGSIASRWSSLASRLGLMVDRAGPGTREIIYGPNTVGLLSGTVYAGAVGSTARLQMTDPASPDESPSAVLGNARTLAAGGVAEVVADAEGSRAFGAARADTAHNGRLRATGNFAQASGYARAQGYDAILEATYPAALANGYARSYPGYAAAYLRATQRGATALGAVQFGGTLEATGVGAFAHGRVYSLANRISRITAGGFGSRAGGFAVAAGIIEAPAIGAEASGHAGSTVAAGGTFGQIRATSAGARAIGKAIAGAPGYDSFVTAAGVGSLALGYAFTGALDTDEAAIRALGPGSLAGGYSLYENSEIQATAAGSVAFGICYTAPGSGGESRIVSAVAGSFAGGAASSLGGSPARIYTNENGALAFGIAHSGYIEAREEGSVALGTVDSGRAIRSTAQGAFAMGDASGGASGDVLATGRGSFAQGRANGADIEATAENAVQFGVGTNSVADSVRIGAAGLHLKGSVGAFGVAANGQIWVTAGGDVMIQSGGAARNISTV